MENRDYLLTDFRMCLTSIIIPPTLEGSHLLIFNLALDVPTKASTAVFIGLYIFYKLY